LRPQASQQIHQPRARKSRSQLETQSKMRGLKFAAWLLEEERGLVLRQFPVGAFRALAARPKVKRQNPRFLRRGVPAATRFPALRWLGAPRRLTTRSSGSSNGMPPGPEPRYGVHFLSSGPGGTPSLSPLAPTLGLMIPTLRSWREGCCSRLLQQAWAQAHFGSHIEQAALTLEPEAQLNHLTFSSSQSGSCFRH
jgi:hypothetical protein